MTIALCFNCGSKKFGSYNRCDACDMIPGTDDDFAWSLGFSDHYLPVEVLDMTSRHMLAGGRRPPVPSDALESILPAARMNRRMLQGLRSGPGEPPKAFSILRRIVVFVVVAALIWAAFRWLSAH